MGADGVMHTTVHKVPWPGFLCQTGGGFKWFLYSPLQSVAIKPEHSLFWEIQS